MENRKSMQEIFTKPEKTHHLFEPVMNVLTVPLLIALGVIIPWVGLPVYVMIKDDHKRNAKMLFIASIVGLGIWIIGVIYGWHLYRENFPRDPNLHP